MAFERAYYIAAKDDPSVNSNLFPEWSKVNIDLISVHYHPSTKVTVAGDRCKVIVIGEPCDTEIASNNTEVVANIINRKYSSLGLSAVLRYVAYLAGRYAIHIYDNPNIFSSVDAFSTYPVYYHENDHGLLLGSNFNLLAELRSIETDSYVLDTLNSPEYVDPYGKKYPGTWTPYKNVRPIITNCYLAYDSESKVLRHKRFYPFEDIKHMNFFDAYNIFETRLLEMVSKLAASASISLPITAGMDSYSILSALRRSNTYKNITTYTYLKKEPNYGPSFLDDAVIGSHRAFKSGLLHRLILLEDPPEKSDWLINYRRTFKYGSQMLKRAYCVDRQVECGATIFVGIGAEVGKVYYGTNDLPITPKTLASFYVQSDFKHNKTLLNEFENYIDYSELHSSRIANYDYKDLFCWEHHINRWSSLVFLEYDISHNTVPVFSDRRLIEAMFMPPTEDRINRNLQRMFHDRYEATLSS